MKFLEQDLEEIICNSNKARLAERGLFFYHDIVKRQLKIGNYGTADIVAYNKPKYFWHNGQLMCDCKRTFYIYELKKDSVNINGFLQAVRYAKGVVRYLEKYKKLDYFSGNLSDYNLVIRLIGKEISTNSDFVYLPEILNTYGIGFDLEFYTYRYGIDGLEFKEHSGYKLTVEGFGDED